MRGLQLKPRFLRSCYERNDVRAIKRAWRDTTMHSESDYDESGAMKAINAVISFFEHPAKKLDDKGTYYLNDVFADSYSCAPRDTLSRARQSLI